MERNSGLDFKVGIFVLIGIVIFTFLVLFIGDFNIFKPGYNIKLIFGFANGLKKSAPVMLAGVNVGQVKSIRIFFDAAAQKMKVEIKVWLQNDAKVTKDSSAEINTLGILGEKYVEISPGSDYSYFLRENDFLIGQDPVSLHEITSLGKKIALKLDKSITLVNEVIGDDKVRADIKSTLDDLKKLTEQIQSGEGTLGKLIYDKKIYGDLEEFVADIKAHPWKLFFRK